MDRSLHLLAAAALATTANAEINACARIAHLIGEADLIAPGAVTATLRITVAADGVLEGGK